MVVGGGAVLWSSYHVSNQYAFTQNPELERALQGEVVVEADLIKSRAYAKPEHVFAAMPQKQFAEYYLPIWNENRSRVIGVIEIYKSPEMLFDTIRRGLQLIWLTAIGGGLLMGGEFRRGHLGVALDLPSRGVWHGHHRDGRLRHQRQRLGARRRR